jgi:hypothetical protein
VDDARAQQGQAGKRQGAGEHLAGGGHRERIILADGSAGSKPEYGN